MNFFTGLIITLGVVGITIFIVAATCEEKRAGVKNTAFLLAISMLGVALFGLMGIADGKNMVYREAVTNGVATYEQVIDKDGSVSNKFVWKK